MAVITQDVELHGLKRGPVFEWLSKVETQDAIFRRAFPDAQVEGGSVWKLKLKTGPRPRELTIRFLRADDEHGGRRVHFRTEGRRLEGNLSYSLRTMKPSQFTMVTLHADYEPGGFLGAAMNSALIREVLEATYRQLLSTLAEAAHEELSP